MVNIRVNSTELIEIDVFFLFTMYINDESNNRNNLKQKSTQTITHVVKNHTE